MVERMEACFDGEVTFHDCDNAMLFLGGGSDDAGFVQIIQGRITDPEKFRHFMEQPMDALQEARPEIIGGTIAMEPDGWFTQTVASAARRRPARARRRRCPSEIQQQYQDEMSSMQDVKYLDLHHPWFSSAGARRAGWQS